MAEPTTARDVHSFPRRAVLAALLAATLAAGATARLGAPRSATATPTRIAVGGGPVALEATLDRSAVLRGSDGLVRMELVLRGRDGDTPSAVRVPTDLVVVLDRSGSMDGQPIATARAAVSELIAGLADGDRFALVSYASDATLDIPLETASRDSRARWNGRLAEVYASGGTHMAGGLDLGQSVLSEAARARHGIARRGVGRVIAISDGMANQGDFSLEGLRARAGRARSGEYVLSSVGIGNGFDETVMSALADAGGGNFYYLPDVEQLAGVFAGEFASARETVARGVAVHITPASGVRIASAGGYLLEPEPGGLSFQPGDLFAGQERRVWLTMNAPTDAAGDVGLGAVRVEFSTPGGERERGASAQLPRLACVASDDDYYASFDADRYGRANLSDSVGALKQSVAQKVAAGRQAEAVAELDSYKAKSEREQLRAFGSVQSVEERLVLDLRNAISAPAAAAPEVRSRLGKHLLESGRDDQRAGAKR